MRFLFFAFVLLVAYVAIDGALSVPVHHGGSREKRQQGGITSIINDDLHVNPVPQWIPFSYTNKNHQRSMQTLTISTQLDRPVTPNKRNKRSADESIPFFFYRVVWGRLPLLDGGNADKGKQDGMGLINKDALKYFLLGLFKPWIPLYYLLKDFSSNLLTLPALFDRAVESHTRSKRIPEGPWFHFFNTAIWPVIKRIITMG